MNSVENLRAVWRRLPPKLRELALTKLTARQTMAWCADWEYFRHKHQAPPEKANDGADWTTWLIIGGRGAGKTRAGAEWVNALARGGGLAERPRDLRIALVGESEHEAREVMVEGLSGVRAIARPGERPRWQPSRRRLAWPNGAVAQVFSAEDPESLRGPQFHAAWLDEFAKWKRAEETFDMLQFGLRLGVRPRQVITTTPRPVPLLKRLIADPKTAVTHAPTRENAFHLAPGFLDMVLARYAGTRLGRQELEGELIEDREGALWTRAILEQARVAQAPPLARIVVAVDPPASASRTADACGLIAAGRAADGKFYVLADETVSGLSPAGWATKAVALWRRLSADALIAEVNQGGDMVRAVIREVDASVPVTAVRARRGKWLRAEPVAALYEQGRVKHVGAFPALEDEMCDFGLDGLSDGRSPDRLDALVWALSALSFGASEGPRMRGL